MSGFPLHDAIAKGKSADKIKALVPKFPAQIYAIQDEQTVFDSARAKDDIDVMLCLLQQAAEIFAQAQKETTKKPWADLKIANSVYDCLHSAFKIILPDKQLPSNLLAAKRTALRPVLFALCQQFIVLYFSCFDISQSFPYVVPKTVDSSLRSLQKIVLGICQDAAVLFFKDMQLESSVKEEKSTSRNDKCNVNLIRIFFKLIYSQLITGDAKVKVAAKKYLDIFLKTGCCQDFFANTQESDLVAVVMSLPSVKPAGDEIVMSLPVAKEINSTDKPLTFSMLLRLFFLQNVRLNSSFANDTLDKRDIALLTVIITFLTAIPREKFPLEPHRPYDGKPGIDPWTRETLVAEFHERRAKVYEKNNDKASAAKDYQIAIGFLNQITDRSKTHEKILSDCTQAKEKLAGNTSVKAIAFDWAHQHQQSKQDKPASPKEPLKHKRKREEHVTATGASLLPRMTQPS